MTSSTGGGPLPSSGLGLGIGHGQQYHYDLSPVVNFPDGVDADEFDPVDFLNGLFPTETSLRGETGGGLDVLSHDIRRAMERLDAQIAAGIGSQAVSTSSSPSSSGGEEGLRSALATLSSLRSRLRTAANRAAATTRAVGPVVADIRRLDNAKRNLQGSITSLRRLHMLTHAMERLEDACGDGRYAEAGSLLAAAREVSEHFAKYAEEVKEVGDCFERLRGLEERLEREVRDRMVETGVALARANGEEEEEAAGGADVADEFDVKVITSDELFQQEEKSKAKGRIDHDADGGDGEETELRGLLRSVAEACSVVDVLGTEARKRQISAFCDSRLACYSNKYRVDDSCVDPAASSLDVVDRRFAFFRKVMKHMEEEVRGIFPSAWNVAYQLVREFLLVTGKHLRILLEGTRNEKPPAPGSEQHSSQVAVLLKALQKTVLFEREMTVRLERDYSLRLSASAATASSHRPHPDEGTEFDADGVAHDRSSATGIRLRIARERRAADQNTAPDAPADRKEIVVLPPVVGVLSDIFVSFMSPYLSLERHNMAELIGSALTDHTVDHRGTELPVFTSSTALFVYIKNSIGRCTVLTRGQTFLDLVAEFRTALDRYADLMLKKMPSPSFSLSQRITGARGGDVLKRQGSVVNVAEDNAAIAAENSANNASTEDPKVAIYKIPAGGEVTVCHVVDTCDYCAETGEALAELIAEKLDPALREEGGDLSRQVDRFHDVTATGLKILVSGLENRAEPCLKKMAGMSWDRLETVGEESPYVVSLTKTIREFCEQVRDLLPNSYYRNFCDKFVAAFVPSFHNALIRLRRISESGTQQLLLDVYNLKTLVLRLPVLGGGGAAGSASGAAPAMYVRYVSKEFARIEMILKCVGTRPELLIDVFRANWPAGTSADLQTVMGLRGMRRAEQQQALEKFGVERNEAVAATSSAAAIASEKAAEGLSKLSEGGSAVAAKVGSDLSDMRRKVEALRQQFA